MDTLDRLFDLEPEIIFQKAREMAVGKRRILASPCVIDTRCTTEPGCRHCKWIGMKGNSRIFPERRTPMEIGVHAVNLEREGVNRVFLASGWMGYDLPDYYCDYVKAVRENTGMEVFGLFGALNRGSLMKLKTSGLDGYLCGIESPNEDVYRSFRPGGDTLSSRITALYEARDLGLKIWTGFLYGFEEKEADIKRALYLFEDLHPDSVSILPFEPFPYTEMERYDPPNPYEWSRIVAVARAFLCDTNIFTEFGSGGLVSYGLRAGANGFYFFPNRRP